MLPIVTARTVRTSVTALGTVRRGRPPGGSGAREAAGPRGGGASSSWADGPVRGTSGVTASGAVPGPGGDPGPARDRYPGTELAQTAPTCPRDGGDWAHEPAATVARRPRTCCGARPTQSPVWLRSIHVRRVRLRTGNQLRLGGGLDPDRCGGLRAEPEVPRDHPRDRRRVHRPLDAGRGVPVAGGVGIRDGVGHRGPARGADGRLGLRVRRARSAGCSSTPARRPVSGVPGGRARRRARAAAAVAVHRGGADGAGPRLRGKAAWLEQRTSLARELHDVVGHHVTAMVVQAEAGQMGDAQAALRNIGDIGRKALGELDALVVHLRDPNARLAVSAPPRLLDIDELLAEAAAWQGVKVAVRLDAELGLDEVGVLTVYRIAQEALDQRHPPRTRRARLGRADPVRRPGPAAGQRRRRRAAPASPRAAPACSASRNALPRVGGSWDLSQRPGGGTVLDVSLPVEHDDERPGRGGRRPGDGP